MTCAVGTSNAGNFVSQGGLTWMPTTFERTWAGADNYCTNTSINGQSGWRMPTVDELSALYKSGAIKGQGWKLFYTWASTPSGSREHYSVGLDNGYAGKDGDTDIPYVTCVHEQASKAAETPEVVAQGGLIWKKIDFIKNWADANAYCNTTTINGLTGWRLPTKAELSAFYNSNVLKGVGGVTWSSTPDGSGSYYSISLNSGDVLWGPDRKVNYVACVH